MAELNKLKISIQKLMFIILALPIVINSDTNNVNIEYAFTLNFLIRLNTFLFFFYKYCAIQKNESILL